MMSLVMLAVFGAFVGAICLSEFLAHKERMKKLDIEAIRARKKK